MKILKKLSQSCKVLNILTKNSEKFNNIEKILYEKNSLLLNVSTNKKKRVFIFRYYY